MSERSSGFVIHTRPYRETSTIVYLFSEMGGRTSAIARGARRPRSALKGLLQPFRPLSFCCVGKGSLKTLTQVEATGPALILSGSRLYSGFYLNELIYLLLRDGIPYSPLYATYQQLLTTLVDIPRIEVALRHFELCLLENLGFGFSLTRTADSGEAIRCDEFYRLQPELGFIACSPRVGSPNIFEGGHLLAIAAYRLDNEANLQAAKRLTRLALHPYLGHRPLKSRELFIQYSKRD